MESTRTALVTGANRGIGLAIARGLRAQGLRVVLTARDVTSAEAAAQSLDDARNASASARAEQDPDTEVLALDVARRDSIARALTELASRGLHIDVLVNNAGILPSGDVLGMAEEAMREAMEVHFFGPLALCRGLVPAMQKARYGRVVNISSDWGSFTSGLEGPAAYSISKATLNALTLKLAGEVGPHVKVNTMCPGWVRTRMGGDEAELSPDEGADTAIWLATLADDGPNGAFFRARTPHPW